MAREGVPHFGRDYDLERWSTGERDSEGKLLWRESIPSNDEWESVRWVTLNLNPGGEPDYRNYKIPPERPLDPYGRVESEFHYDLDDLALQAFLDYGYEF